MNVFILITLHDPDKLVIVLITLHLFAEGIESFYKTWILRWIYDVPKDREDLQITPN